MKKSNILRLFEYCSRYLLRGKNRDEVLDLLSGYARIIEEILESYRNPSAHANALRRIDAEECFKLIIDVEKYMKKLLDSFDY